jgi:hypothetical protein
MNLAQHEAVKFNTQAAQFIWYLAPPKVLVSGLPHSTMNFHAGQAESARKSEAAGRERPPTRRSSVQAVTTTSGRAVRTLFRLTHKPLPNAPPPA